MLLNNINPPTSLTVTIWSLRSVPITLWGLMFVFNSGSIKTPHPNLHFWFDAIAVLGIVGIVGYWNRIKGLRWNAGAIIYLYICLSLLLRNPYGVLTAGIQGQLSHLNTSSLCNSLYVGLGILAIALLLELLIVYIKRLHTWTWWLAFLISILYVSSIIFFFSGTLGIWSLLDPDTKKVFRQAQRKSQLVVNS